MSYVDNVIEQVKAKNAEQPEFIQAVTEVLQSLEPVIEAHPEYEEAALLERIVEPERVIMFRVPWVDDNGKVQVNRGFRVQFNSAIGPYKGGLRLHPSVNLGIIKFLGFEQIFKNSLTTLPMGGGKGGCDFDPKGKSDMEVMRFCQAFMTELFRHIGADTDVPAGDIGTGAREIGYMFGQYKKIKNVFEGVLTGKGLSFGGSLARTEATGYGLVYLVEEYLKCNGDSFDGKTVLHLRLRQRGHLRHARRPSSSAPRWSPCPTPPAGSTTRRASMSTLLKQIKEVERGRITEYADRAARASSTTRAAACGSSPATSRCPAPPRTRCTWRTRRTLVKNGCKIRRRGRQHAHHPRGHRVRAGARHRVLLPGKAANAGGVATSGLEMSQNSDAPLLDLRGSGRQAARASW